MIPLPTRSRAATFVTQPWGDEMAAEDLTALARLSQGRRSNKHLARLNQQAAAGDGEQTTLLRALLYEQQRTNQLLVALLNRPQA